MSLPIEIGVPSTGGPDKASFQDVVAYLHGVTDAVQAMQRSALSAWPAVIPAPLSTRPTASDALEPSGEPRKSARLTLRHGQAAIELEGVLVLSPAVAPFHALAVRGGARFVELDGAADAVTHRHDPHLRGTLPYWAPAVSLIPLRPFSGETERPSAIAEQSATLPYAALALSLVPIAAAIPSGWPDEGGEERISAVRLRAAPLSPELYALTGTDDWDR